MINALLKRRMANAKKNKKGFTLVELIVVLVIIAILAAVLVPTMSGYIGKTKKSAAQSQTKTVVTAAASAATDIISDHSPIEDDDATDFAKYMKDYGGSNITDNVEEIDVNASTGAVTYVEYVDGSYYCVYDGEEYDADKGDPDDHTVDEENDIAIYTGDSNS